MIYRGFRIERVIYHNNGNGAPAHRIEYVIMESVTGTLAREVGMANDLVIAMEMIDRILTARYAMPKGMRIAV